MIIILDILVPLSFIFAILILRLKLHGVRLENRALRCALAHESLYIEAQLAPRKK